MARKTGELRMSGKRFPNVVSGIQSMLPGRETAGRLTRLPGLESGGY